MKIVIVMQDASFWYDVHSLVKSFYPGADVLRTDGGYADLRILTEDGKIVIIDFYDRFDIHLT